MHLLELESCSFNAVPNVSGGLPAISSTIIKVCHGTVQCECCEQWLCGVVCLELNGNNVNINPFCCMFYRDLVSYFNTVHGLCNATAVQRVTDNPLSLVYLCCKSKSL